MKKPSAYKLIFGVLGLFLVFVGVMCLLPLSLLIFYPEESHYWYNFFIPGISAIVIGVLLMVFLLRKSQGIRLGKFQDSVLLVLIWISAIIICSIPFFLKEDMNFSQGVFETTSGFSTIGLTVYTDFDCHLFVFYRSLLTLIGGVGLVLVITSAVSDKYGLRLYSAEGHSDKLIPSLRKSATLILGIYLGIIIVGTLAYWAAGMPLFDAMVHSISAVATGGFSSKAGGLTDPYFTSRVNMPAVEIISIVLMVLGATNFLTTLLLITGKFKKAIKDCELKVLAILIVIFIPLFFLSSFAGYGWKNGGNAFRHGAFTFFSAITTTGFSNVSNVVSLGQGTMFLIILINVIGGGMGSTAGGVKQYRIAVAAKSFFWSTREKMAPARMVYPHFITRCGEEKEVTSQDAHEAYGYIFLYLVLMFVGAFFVTLFSGWSFGDSLFEFSNAISSTGLSNGLTSACATNNGVLWTMIIGMFAGRLEILAIWFAFFRMGRDILRKETI